MIPLFFNSFQNVLRYLITLLGCKTENEVYVNEIFLCH